MKKFRKFIVLAVLFAFAALSAGAGLAQSAQTTVEQAKTEAQAQELKVQADKAVQTAQHPDEIIRRQRAEQERLEMEIVVKTYTLKYINTSDFMRSAKFYVVDSSGTESTLTVRIFKKNIPDFEALLKKLDIEKKNIQFQVYTILASKDDPPEAYKTGGFFGNETKDIEDRELKKVLDEMKGLWNFKHYWIDNPSFLITKDGAGQNRSRLVSRFALEINLREVRLRGDEPGKRIIAVGEIGLVNRRDSNTETLINTSDINFKEKGYLVVGVSGLSGGWSGLALILVISAEIK